MTEKKSKSEMKREKRIKEFKEWFERWEHHIKTGKVKQK